MPSRAVAASVAVAALSVWVAGCGAGAGGDAAEDDVRTVVSSYVRASVAGNGEQACGYYTPALRAQIERKAKDAGLAGCTELLGSAVRYRLSQLSSDLRGRVEQAISDPENVAVELAEEGERATAALALPDEAMTETRVALVQRPEGWRIDRLGVKDQGEP